jgi:hypothetical protein
VPAMVPAMVLVLVLLSESQPDRLHQRVCAPSVFGRNLQCELVRKVDTREECHWSRACSRQANIRGIQWHPRV